MSELLSLWNLQQAGVDVLRIHSEDTSIEVTMDQSNLVGSKVHYDFSIKRKATADSEAQTVAETVNTRTAQRLALVSEALKLLLESAKKVEVISTGISENIGCCPNCDAHRELFDRTREISKKMEALFPRSVWPTSSTTDAAQP